MLLSRHVCAHVILGVHRLLCFIGSNIHWDPSPCPTKYSTVFSNVVRDEPGTNGPVSVVMSVGVYVIAMSMFSVVA